MFRPWPPWLLWVEACRRRCRVWPSWAAARPRSRPRPTWTRWITWAAWRDRGRSRSASAALSRPPCSTPGRARGRTSRRLSKLFSLEPRPTERPLSVSTRERWQQEPAVSRFTRPIVIIRLHFHTTLLGSAKTGNQQQRRSSEIFFSLFFNLVLHFYFSRWIKIHFFNY